MAWVCTCGQKNLVSGLPCLACDRLAPQDAESSGSAGLASRFAEPGGTRFRSTPPPVEEPSGGRFREDPDLIEVPPTPAPVEPIPTPAPVEPAPAPVPVEPTPPSVPVDPPTPVAPPTPVIEEEEFVEEESPAASWPDVDRRDDTDRRDGTDRRAGERRSSPEPTPVVDEGPDLDPDFDGPTTASHDFTNEEFDTEYSDVDDDLYADLDDETEGGNGGASNSADLHYNEFTADEGTYVDDELAEDPSDLFVNWDDLSELVDSGLDEAGFAIGNNDVAANDEGFGSTITAEAHDFSTGRTPAVPVDVDAPAAPWWETSNATPAPAPAPLADNFYENEEFDTEDEFDFDGDPYAPANGSAAHSTDIDTDDPYDDDLYSPSNLAGGTFVGSHADAFDTDSSVGGPLFVDEYNEYEDGEEFEELFDEDDVDADPFGIEAVSPGNSNYAEPKSSKARFATHVDLDQPEEFESEYDDWAFEDDEDDDFASLSREPGRKGRSKPTPRKKSNGKAPKAGELTLGGFVNKWGKVLVVIAVLIVIILLSTLGSDVFERVGAAQAGSGSAAECAAETSGAVRPAELQTSVAGFPGWKARPDYEASTGVIDFARALQLEPNDADALGTLDRTRFLGGYDRSYVSPSMASASLNVSIYQFAGDSCAADYVRDRSKSAEADKKFDVDKIESAHGWVSGSTYTVVASEGSKAMIITMSKPDSKTAMDQMTLVAETQFAALFA